MHRIYPFSKTDSNQKVLEFDVNLLASYSDEMVGNNQDTIKDMKKQLKDADDQWVSTDPNEYCPTVPNRVGSKKFIDETFKFPQSIRHTANKFSKDFVSLLTKDVRCGIIRNQSEGRWDVRKIPKLYTKFRSNNFDISDIRPFEKRGKLLKNPPHVGIVADGSYGKMWGSDDYIPNILTLIIGSSFACQAAGFNTTAALTVGSGRPGFKMVSHLLVDENRTIDLNKYGIYFHRDNYRGAIHNAALFNEEVYVANGECWGFYGGDGGNAVEYIRNKGAEIVISIGDTSDKDDADIVIEDVPDLEKALSDIAFKLKNIYDKKVA